MGVSHIDINELLGLRWKENDVVKCKCIGGDTYVVAILGIWRDHYIVGIISPPDLENPIPNTEAHKYKETNWHGHLSVFSDGGNVYKVGKIVPGKGITWSANNSRS